jgi:hypothetical protein
MSQSFDFAGLRKVQADVQTVTHTPMVQATSNITTDFTGGSQKSFTVVVTTYGARDATDQDASTVAAIVLRDVPEVRQHNRVTVTFVRGYDLLFARGWQWQYWSYTPAEWESRIGRR